MNDTLIGAEYSATLAKAIAAESLACISDTPALSEQDVADLKGILSGTKTTTGPIDVKRAVAILAHSEPSAESGEILAQSGYPLYSSCPDGGTIALIYQLLVGRQMPIGCLGAVCFTANLWLKRQNHPESPAKSTGTNAGSRPDMSARITRVKWITRLAQILGNSGESTEVRVSAAANLGVLGTEAGEKALLASLETEDPFVRREVIKSLGKIGSAESLRRLDSLPETASGLDRKLADFARMTIAFREGSDDRDSMLRSQPLEVIEADRVTEIVRKIWGPTYGVDLNREVGFTVYCGRSPLSILVNSELKRGSWLETLRSRPLIAGIVTAKESEVERFSVRNLLMTKPTETGFAIVATRTGGDVVFAGKAEPEGDGFRLSVRDVGPEATQTEIAGIVTNDSVELNLHTWRGTARSKKRGEAVRM